MQDGCSRPCASRRTAATSAFFFQAEDGIRDTSVTGVQTCALPISYTLELKNLVGPQCFSVQGYRRNRIYPDFVVQKGKNAQLNFPFDTVLVVESKEIGRASCRERV